MTLEATEGKYRALFDAAGDGILLIGDGHFVEWNAVALEMFDCREEDLSNKRPEEFSPEFQPDGARSRERASEYLTKAQEGEPQRFEWLHQRMDGTPFPAEVTLTRVDTCGARRVLAVVRDITPRKRAEEALRTSEAKYRTFFENSCDPMLMLKGDRFVDCNAATVEALGFRSKAQVLNKHPADTSPEFQPEGISSVEKAAEMIATVHAKGTHRFEWTHVRTNGDVFPVEVSMTAMPSQDGTLLLAIWRDISDRVRVEKEREALEEQLRQSQKMEAIGQLAGGIAHDFNNLLHVIMGYGDLVRSKAGPGSELQADMAEVIKAAERASDLVRQLLAFGRRQMLKLELIDLKQVIDDLGRMTRSVIGENIEFRTTAGPGRHTVMADQGQLEQILMNLCVNARDAMASGGKLTIETNRAKLDTAFCKDNPWARPGQYVVLSVTDTGHGMDEETKRRVFEPFFTTKGEGGGTGLGLSTIYGIVRQHGGMVHIESEPGLGTTFHTYLPWTEGTPERKKEAPTQSPPTGSEVVLLAEDDDSVRRLAGRSLQAAGYTVLSAENGEEAIRLFDSRGGDVDLAVLDVVMPSLGGRAVSDHIRDVEHGTPVLFVSGYSSGAVHNDFILEEGLQLLPKPYKSTELLKRVRRMLDSRARHRWAPPLGEAK